jgi:hypothetical protein
MVMIYRSIGSFIWSRKKYTFEGQKGENKPSKPKKRNLGSKINMVGDISSDRKFYMEDENCIIGVQKG